LKKRKREKLMMKKDAKRQNSEMVIWSGKKDPQGLLCEEMIKKYQNEIRHSPVYRDMVREHGVHEAEKMLKGFRIFVR
jgi:hypothetical protein